MDVTRCMFCYLPANLTRPAPDVRWECQACGPYWTSFPVRERAAQHRGQVGVKDLRKLLAEGIGTEGRPIGEADLGW